MENWAAPSEHIWYLNEKFTTQQIICAILECASLDPYFSPTALLEDGHVLGRIGVSVGGLPAASMLFLVDMMRIGMAEVYGHYFGIKALRPCYRRMCGNPGLNQIGGRERRLLAPMLRFFSEQMLNLRGRIRFHPGIATYMCKRALEAPLVCQTLNAERLDGLKDVLHFTGLRLYELALVSDPMKLFVDEGWRRALMKRQLHEYAGRGLRLVADEAGDDCTERMCHAFLHGPSESIVKETGLDAWGNSGPDMMNNALALFMARMESGGVELEPMHSDCDFSKVRF